MSNAFRARYGGRCGQCDEPIREADLVRYDDDELVHDTCPSPAPDPYTVGPRETICNQCFTIHAGECL